MGQFLTFYDGINGTLNHSLLYQRGAGGLILHVGQLTLDLLDIFPHIQEIFHHLGLLFLLLNLFVPHLLLFCQYPLYLCQRL